MDEDRSLALIEEGEYRFEGWVAQIKPLMICLEHEAVGVQFVEGNGDLGQTTLDIREGE